MKTFFYKTHSKPIDFESLKNIECLKLKLAAGVYSLFAAFYLWLYFNTFWDFNAEELLRNINLMTRTIFLFVGFSVGSFLALRLMRKIKGLTSTSLEYLKKDYFFAYIYLWMFGSFNLSFGDSLTLKGVFFNVISFLISTGFSYFITLYSWNKLIASTSTMTQMSDDILS